MPAELPLNLSSHQIARKLGSLANIQCGNFLDRLQEALRVYGGRCHNQIARRKAPCAAFDSPAPVALLNPGYLVDKNLSRTLRQALIGSFGIEVETLQIEKQPQGRDLHGKRLHGVQIIKGGKVLDLRSRTRVSEHADQIVGDGTKTHSLDHIHC